MNSATMFGYCGAMLVGLGLFGLVTNPEILRKILAFNVL
jgi:multicomponent Na+:H+ antiporter subunit C